MLKKTLYPLTDWNWLKLPLAFLAVGVMIFVLFLTMAGSLVLHGPSNDAAFGGFIVSHMGITLIFLIQGLGFSGYLVRVMRQPKSDKPHKLPKWDALLKLFKEGALTAFGSLMMVYFFIFLAIVPFLLFFAFSMKMGIMKAIHQVMVDGGIAGLAVGLAHVAVGIISYFIALTLISVFVPLMVARYAHTGKFRHLLSPRWAWRAFTVAPLQYILRTSAWFLYLVIITVLTPLTFIGAYFIMYATWPLMMINMAYMVGDYYAVYLDD